MNIYLVKNIDTLEEYTATTEEVMAKLYITKDALYWHAKVKSPYAGYMFEKIGDDGKSNKPKKARSKGTKTNKGLDYDLKQARKQGLSYGEWKNLQYLRG